MVSGPPLSPRQSISTPSSSILEDDHTASEISNPTRMFLTPLIDEFFSEEIETDEKQEIIQVPLIPENFYPNDDNKYDPFRFSRGFPQPLEKDN